MTNTRSTAFPSWSVTKKAARRAEAEPIFRIKIPRVGERAVRRGTSRDGPAQALIQVGLTRSNTFASRRPMAIYQRPKRGGPWHCCRLSPPCPWLTFVPIFDIRGRFWQRILQRISTHPLPFVCIDAKDRCKDDPFLSFFLSSSSGRKILFVSFFCSRCEYSEKNL